MKPLPKRKQGPNEKLFDRTKTHQRKVMSRGDLEIIHSQISEAEHLIYNFSQDSKLKAYRNTLKHAYERLKLVRDSLQAHGIGGPLCHDQDDRPNRNDFHASPSDSDFRDIDTIIKQSKTPAEAWRQMVELLREQSWPETGPESVHKLADDLAALDVAAAVTDFAGQLSAKWAKKPPQKGIQFLFFGLFSAVRGNRTETGCYLSGGIRYDPADDDSVSNLTYFPPNRMFRSAFLNKIKQAAESDKRYEAWIEYALMLGGAAILVKFAKLEMLKKFKLIVGFDSGDFLVLN